MSNDATAERQTVPGRRVGSHIMVEPLALKAIGEWTKLNGKTPAFRCKLNSFYMALLAIARMNGKGAILRKKMVEDFSGVRHELHPELREALVDIELLCVTEDVVGSKKTVRFWLLRLPHQGVAHRAGIRPGEESPSGAEKLEHEAGHRTGIRPFTGATVTPSEVSTNVDTSSGGVSSDSKPKSSGPLASWTRDRLRSWHEEHPDEIPELANGVSDAAALMCAITTTPGYAELEATCTKGFGDIISRVHMLLGRTFREARIPYSVWMTAALSFSKIPTPKDGNPVLAYYIAALGREAERVISREAEAAHRRRESGEEIPEARRITADDLRKAFAEAKLQGVL